MVIEDQADNAGILDIQKRSHFYGKRAKHNEQMSFFVSRQSTKHIIAWLTIYINHKVLLLLIFCMI